MARITQRRRACEIPPSRHTPPHSRRLHAHPCSSETSSNLSNSGSLSPTPLPHQPTANPSPRLRQLHKLPTLRVGHSPTRASLVSLVRRPRSGRTVAPPHHLPPTLILKSCHIWTQSQYASYPSLTRLQSRSLRVRSYSQKLSLSPGVALHPSLYHLPRHICHP